MNPAFFSAICETSKGRENPCATSAVEGEEVWESCIMLTAEAMQ